MKFTEAQIEELRHDLGVTAEGAEEAMQKVAQWVEAARDAAFDECIKAIDDQIDPEALRLGDQCEHGMTVAVDILRAAKKGTP